MRINKEIVTRVQSYDGAFVMAAFKSGVVN